MQVPGHVQQPPAQGVQVGVEGVQHRQAHGDLDLPGRRQLGGGAA